MVNVEEDVEVVVTGRRHVVLCPPQAAPSTGDAAHGHEVGGLVGVCSSHKSPGLEVPSLVLILVC